MKIKAVSSTELRRKKKKKKYFFRNRDDGQEEVNFFFGMTYERMHFTYFCLSKKSGNSSGKRREAPLLGEERGEKQTKQNKHKNSPLKLSQICSNHLPQT